MIRIPQQIQGRNRISYLRIAASLVVAAVVVYILSIVLYDRLRPTVNIRMEVWQGTWNYSSANSYLIELREGDAFGPATVSSGLPDSTFRVGRIVNDTTVRIYFDDSFQFYRRYNQPDRSVRDSILVCLTDLLFRGGEKDYRLRIDTTRYSRDIFKGKGKPRAGEVTELDLSRGWTWSLEVFYGDGTLRGRVGYAFNDERRPTWHGLRQDFAPNGQILNEMEWHYGEPHGRYAEWYENGVKKIEGQNIRSDGPEGSGRHGQWKFWDETGRLCGIGTYDHGTGETRLWYEDSSLMAVEYYKHGEKDSVWQKWFKNGNLMAVEYYRNCAKDSLWLEWYENGQVKTVRDYRDKSSMGRAELYSPDGNLEYTNEQYASWDMHGRNYYGNGQMRFENGQHWYRAWYSDGQKKIEYGRKATGTHWSDRYDRHGPHTEWYPDGKVRLTGQWVDGEETGTWTEYATDGAVVSTCLYRKDEPGVIRTNFFANGNIESTGTCLADRISRVGTWLYFDKDGNLLRVEEWADGFITYIDGQRIIP